MEYYGNKTWNNAIDNKDKSVVPLREESLQKILPVLEQSGLNYYAYVKDGTTIVSIGNFSEKDKTIRLTIDWKALGMDPAKAKITAPAIPCFQEERSFAPLRMTGGQLRMTGIDNLSVKAKEGWMLVIER